MSGLVNWEHSLSRHITLLWEKRRCSAIDGLRFWFPLMCISMGQIQPLSPWLSRHQKVQEIGHKSRWEMLRERGCIRNKVGEEQQREKTKMERGDWWRREGQRTFWKWTLVIHTGAGKKGGRKVGYHSGSWLLEIAVQMPSPSTYLLPSVPLHRYI